uniref:Putative secreted peptide n=1 Tax=Anopheles braziliensis TaxID=58242 RepID=A0A2M3ZRE7_9DIPT
MLRCCCCCCLVCVCVCGGTRNVKQTKCASGLCCSTQHSAHYYAPQGEGGNKFRNRNYFAQLENNPFCNGRMEGTLKKRKNKKRLSKTFFPPAKSGPSLAKCPVM